MSSCETHCLVITFVIILAVAMVSTTFASDMMIYDEGNIYSCPVDYMNEALASKYATSDDEGKAYQIDKISHKQFEDMFYDPMECRPFYQDDEAPIWFGRVENMEKLNQKIFVYGFVTTSEKEIMKGQELHLEFSMEMRAKNMNDEEWDHLNEDEPF